MAFQYKVYTFADVNSYKGDALTALKEFRGDLKKNKLI